MFRKAVAFGVWVLVAWPATALGEPRLLAAGQQRTVVRSYAGIGLVSVWDGTRFSLAVSRSGGALTPLQVPARDLPFDADIGSGGNGIPVVTFSTCAAAGCALSAMVLEGTPVDTGTTVPSGAVHPTVWRGEFTWVEGRRVRSYLRTLHTVRRGTTIDDIERYGKWLALTTTELGAAGVCGRKEVWLVDVAERRARLLAGQTCGLNGQSWAGLSFSAGWLYFGRTRNTAGDRSFGVYRVRLRDRRVERSADPGPIVSWAVAGPGAGYVVRGREGYCMATVPGFDCQFLWTDALRFTRARLPR
jgi:hypothetical protein